MSTTTTLKSPVLAGRLDQIILLNNFRDKNRYYRYYSYYNGKDWTIADKANTLLGAELPLCTKASANLARECCNEMNKRFKESVNRYPMIKVKNITSTTF